MFQYLDRFTPRLLLIVIDLPKIKHLALDDAIAPTTAILQ